MSRFPKGLVLAAVILELMILTVASRTENFSRNDAAVGVNRMLVAPALPDQSASATKKVQSRPAVANNASKKPQGKDVDTQVFAKAPQHVI